MFGLQDLKPKITRTKTTVECPVKGCHQIVARQTKQDLSLQENKFQCHDHKIYISPSTFEYADEKYNLLWQNKSDLDLLGVVKMVKRESRMARDNSEDALTWNVFRYFENTNQLANLLSYVTRMKIGNAELIYWSYSQKAKGAWPELK